MINRVSISERTMQFLESMADNVREG